MHHYTRGINWHDKSSEMIVSRLSIGRLICIPLIALCFVACHLQPLSSLSVNYYYCKEIYIYWKYKKKPNIAQLMRG